MALSFASDGLTDEHTAEFKEAFDTYVKGKEPGKIQSKELGNVMRYLGHNPTQAQIEQMTNELGGSGGFILWEPFFQMMAKRVTADDKEEDVLEAFRVFDRDGNGNISATELRHVMCAMGEKLEESEVDELIKEADRDGDGQINYEAFVRLMLKN